MARHPWNGRYRRHHLGGGSYSVFCTRCELIFTYPHKRPNTATLCYACLIEVDDEARQQRHELMLSVRTARRAAALATRPPPDATGYWTDERLDHLDSSYGWLEGDRSVNTASSAPPSGFGGAPARDPLPPW